jgi:hypothetical protein
MTRTGGGRREDEMGETLAGEKSEVHMKKSEGCEQFQSSFFPEKSRRPQEIQQIKGFAKPLLKD